MQDHNRFPAPHATTHKRNGSDEILLDELGLPLDVTNLNASNTRHGLLLKLTDVTNQFLRADGQWAIPPSSGGGGADATAWHKTGDSFGADSILGTMDDYNLKFYTNGTEVARFRNSANLDGALLIGATVDTMYPDADIVYIKKNLGDQLLVTLQNTHNNVALPSGTGFIMVNADGTVTGGINLFNADWPSGGSDGVFPNETALLAFGGNCVVGTQTHQDLRFIVNNTEFAIIDESAADFIISGGNLKVPNGIISALNTGAQLTIGTAGSPSSGGAIKCGKTGLWGVALDDVGGISGVTVTSGTNRWAIVDIVSAASSGNANAGAWERLINADGRTLWFAVPESGIGTSYIAKANYATISTSGSCGLRCNVATSATSVWEVDVNNYMTFGFVRVGFFSATPVIQQALGIDFVNNVTSGGTSDTVSDYSSLTIYATDAAAIRGNIYQLARTLNQVTHGLRLLGLFS